MEEGEEYVETLNAADGAPLLVKFTLMKTPQGCSAC